jgi:hypothetical protein
MKSCFSFIKGRWSLHISEVIKVRNLEVFIHYSNKLVNSMNQLFLEKMKVLNFFKFHCFLYNLLKIERVISKRDECIYIWSRYHHPMILWSLSTFHSRRRDS